MTDTYSPKYLKHEPPRGQEVEDLEVFNLVKHNPSRKVDANDLPPVAMDNNGKLFFTDPAPTLSDTVQAVGGLLLLALGVLIGGAAAVCALVSQVVNAHIVAYCVIGIMALTAILRLKGEKKNVQHK